MRDDRSLVLVTILVLVAVVRVVVPGFFDYSDDDATLIQNGGSIGSQIIWLGLVLIPLTLLRNRIKLTWMLLRTVNGWFLLLTLYACASVLWSIDTGATLRKLSHLIGLYGVCITVCLVGWNARRFQGVLRPVLTAFMVGSIIFGLVRPDLAIMGPNLAAGDPGGSWRGLTIHKNALGSAASFAVILWFQAWLYRETKWWAVAVGLASSLACLYLSQSSTSLVATLMVIIFLLLGKLTPPSLRPRLTPVVITVFLIVIIGYGLAAMKLVPGMDALISAATSSVGKDTSFNGRAPIWDLVKNNLHCILCSEQATADSGSVPSTPLPPMNSISGSTSIPGKRTTATWTSSSTSAMWVCCCSGHSSYGTLYCRIGCLRLIDHKRCSISH